MAGYLTAATGSITTPLGGPATDREYQRRHLGFVFQQLNLLPLATVMRNLTLAGSLAGLSSQQIGERAGKCCSCSASKLLPRAFQRRFPADNNRRATIARALVKEPLVLLLDEPTSGLDDLNTRVISRALRDYVTGNRICIISSHDSRLEPIAHEILDFNRFLPVERHLEALA